MKYYHNMDPRQKFRSIFGCIENFPNVMITILPERTIGRIHINIAYEMIVIHISRYAGQLARQPSEDKFVAYFIA